MRRLRNHLAFAACLNLLSLQLSGLHVHADETGYIGAPETPFTHSHFHHDHSDAHHGGTDTTDDGGHKSANLAHDHEDAKDVSLLDLALSAFKMPLAILSLFLLFTAFPRLRRLASTEFAYRVLSGRHTRWRPPLRAPPQPA